MSGFLCRNATLTDVDAIYKLGTTYSDFSISESIRFYDQVELVEWIGQPNENILVIAESNSKIAGFFYCKVMSSRWAMLDNFFVVPQERGSTCGKDLFKFLTTHLRTKKINYLSTLIHHDRRALSRHARRYGFKVANQLVWHEYEIG